MTKDDIMKLALESGFAKILDEHASEYRDFTFELSQDHYPELGRFIDLVAAHKAEVITAEAYRCGYKDGMEAGSVICDNVARKYQHAHTSSKETIADKCAAAIRERIDK
jgi:hypothetical protein